MGEKGGIWMFGLVFYVGKDRLARILRIGFGSRGRSRRGGRREEGELKKENRRRGRRKKRL